MLEWLLKLGGLDWELRDGKIVIVTPKPPPPPSPTLPPAQ
jgi:hypothetical protein